MMTTPKYRTDLTACSCPGYWYRKTCRHIIAYRAAVALVQAQDVTNSVIRSCSPIPANFAAIGGPRVI